MADKGVFKPRELFPGEGVSVDDLVASLEKEIKGEAEVEESLCAHSAQEGVGTKKTGYAAPDMGPFLCVNCVHASKNGTRCDHPEVVADPEVPKEGKLARIEPAACCNEFHPMDVE